MNVLLLTWCFMNIILQYLCLTTHNVLFVYYFKCSFGFLIKLTRQQRVEAKRRRAKTLNSFTERVTWLF